MSLTNKKRKKKKQMKILEMNQYKLTQANKNKNCRKKKSYKQESS